MRLYILRHGKPERDSHSGRDEDRPLAVRGVEQARWIGERLARGEIAPRPARVLASPALRARDTALLVAEPLRLAVEFCDDLSLEASLSRAAALAERLRDAGEAVLLVGHNPQLASLAQHLGGEGVMHTGELAAFDLNPAVAAGAAKDADAGRWRLAE